MFRSSAYLPPLLGLALLSFTTIWTANGLSCHCSSAFCSSPDSSCNVTAPEIRNPRKFCLVKKYIHYDGSKSLEQSCMTSEITLSYFSCLERGICASIGGEACLCCTEDYCNTEEFYNEKLGIRNASTDSSSTTLTSTFASPSKTSEPATSPTATASPSPPTTVAGSKVAFSADLIVIVILSVAIPIVGVCIVVIVIAHITVKVNSKTAQSDISSHTSEESHSPGILDSGSGAGLPLLAQRSIALDINLIRQIGRGRYGEVWHGTYQSKDVAVKIFEAHEETSWEKETAIYATNLLSHPNILRFMGADNKDVHFCTQRWLVFEHCELKSLYEYLQSHTLPENIFCTMALGIVSGLSHLHTEIHGKIHKPAIAHRDFKSGNILVRGDLSCCIADLGLALCSTSMREVSSDPSKAIVGTKRYLAPEILDGSINTKSFQSFVQADVYSLSLVLWEMARRVLSEEKALEYQLPYQDCTSRDPSLKDMKEVVCKKGKRPHIPNTWDDSPTLSLLSEILEGCWAVNTTAKARLSALRILKTLQSLTYSKNISSKALFQSA